MSGENEKSSFASNSSIGYTRLNELLLTSYHGFKQLLLS